MTKKNVLSIMEDQNTKENVETNNNDVKPKVIILEPIIFSFRNKSNIIVLSVFSMKREMISWA